MRATTWIGMAAIGLAVVAAPRPAPAHETVEAASPRALAIDDFFAIGEVEDPRISPDGKWVAFTVTRSDLDKDKRSTRVWMVPADGGEAVPLTAEDESSSQPRWSPDGRHLAFLSARDGGQSEVWTLFREGGEAVPVTDTAQGVTAYEWSPDGQRLVLVLRDPRPEELEARELKERGVERVEEPTPPPWVVDRRQFKQDYEGYLDRYRTHLYVLELGAGEMRQITSGDYDDSEPAWSPDGRSIAFVSNRTDDPDANDNSDIWLVAADNTDRGATLRRVSSNPGRDDSPAWSPDGKLIAYRAATDVAAIVYATPHLAVAPARGGEERVLTAELDRVIYDPRFTPDGRSILFLMEDSAEQPLARIGVTGGKVERLVSGADTVEAFDVGAGGAIVAAVSTPRRPAELYRVAAGKLEQLSRVNDELFASLRLGEMESVRYPSPDGTEIEGFVVKPPGFDPALRYPVILRIHGGPMAQYDHRFHFEAQLLAANGYVVVLPNPRGSTGYGQPFCLAIWQAWGEKDLEDVLAGVDWVIAQGYGDPERLGVGGWSYGGMLTNHAITKTDRFKGAITGASATLYVVNYGHDQYQRWWEDELGLPWKPESRELWDRLSPFNRVEKVVTPTLIVGGEKDWNVPIINSEQLFLALKRLGVTTELVVYPGEFHGIRVPSYRKDLYVRYLDWYDRHVKGVPADAR